MKSFPTELTQFSQIADLLQERRTSFFHQLRTRGLDAGSASFLRGSVRLLGDNLLSLDNDNTEPEVDTEKLIISRTITTPRKDRYGDVVLPMGCQAHLHNYQANPQVFFGHQSADKPIARTIDLQVLEEKIRAKAQFHEETEEARVVFRLAAKGWLPGTSIGFLPVRAAIIGSNKTDEEIAEEQKKRRTAKTDDGEKIIDFDAWMALRFLEWDLLEWSVVSVPANPDCVEGITQVLSAGQIEGEKIPLSIRKSLEPFALKSRVWCHGFDPSKVNYSGTLLLGEEELEYQDGKMIRIGEYRLVKEEKPQEEEPPVDPQSAPSLPPAAVPSEPEQDKALTVLETPPVVESVQAKDAGDDPIEPGVDSPKPQPEVSLAEIRDVLVELKNAFVGHFEHDEQQRKADHEEMIMHLKCIEEALKMKAEEPGDDEEEKRAQTPPEKSAPDLQEQAKAQAGLWDQVLAELKKSQEMEGRLREHFFSLTGRRI
jgi:phage head maturation protease